MLVKAINNSLVRSMVACSRMGQIRALSAKGHVENIGLAEPKHGRQETDEQFDQRYIQYFSRPDIDNWELRKGINDLHGMDLIPEPAVIVSALEAARRLNDHSICVRFLEALRWKSRFDPNIYPYLIQEIRPTLDKLGISTPEELGYHEPELTIEDCFDK